MAESHELWLLVGLLTVTIPLVALARRVNVSYPVVLVLGGLALGFVPGLPQIRLDPNLVLLIFLPPLLYWEAITAPTDVMRANSGQIWLMAIGLVLATTLTVAAIAHACIAGLTWPMAFVLGAIVAPTDELASAAVLERMRVPRHLIAIVEGESLLNDASSLILYAAAVTAATTGGSADFQARDRRLAPNQGYAVAGRDLVQPSLPDLHRCGALRSLRRARGGLRRRVRERLHPARGHARRAHAGRGLLGDARLLG